MAGISLVVTDLDGTLWDARERIHDRTLAALRTLERRGMPLLVATGRRPRSAITRLAADGLQPPAVFLDGALGADLSTGHRFLEAGFTAAQASGVLDAFEAAGMSPCVYVGRPDVDVVVGAAPSTHPRHLEYIGPWLARDDLRRVVKTEDVFSFGIAGRPYDQFGEVVDRLEGVADAAVNRDLLHGGATLMVRPPGVSKWQGVLTFCEQRDLDPHRVLALGDGENDVELLEGASVACVVSDGCEAALALADHVIAPAAEGGWGAVLELC